MTGTQSSAGLPRQLGIWSATAIVVGLTIGSGIFRTPATIATRLPGPLLLVATWIVAGLIVLGMDPSVPPYDGYVGSLAAVAIIVISIVNCLGIK